MNTNTTHKARVEQWTQIISACDQREAGISKKVWCEQHNIRLKNFEYWQRVLRKEAIDYQASDSISDNPASDGCLDITDRLLEPSAASQVAVSAPSNSKSPQLLFQDIPELMIQAGSYLVYVNETVHEKTLRTVLRALNDA